MLGGGGGGGGGGAGGGGGVALPPPAPAETRRRCGSGCRACLGGRWNKRWLKRADKRRKPKAKRPLPGGHASVYKLMRAAKQHRAEKP